MSWIEEAGPGEQDLPAIFQAISLDPEALEKVQQLNETLAFGSSRLTRAQEEAIATVVAVANRCRYGAMTHAGFLRRHSEDQELTIALLSDYTQAGLDSADQRMLQFSVQLTREPSSITRQDLEELRQAEFDDGQILSIVLVTSLFNFMNRLADGLGVDVPPGYQAAVERWLTGPTSQEEWLMQPKEG